MSALDDLIILQQAEKALCEKSLSQFVRSAWHIIEPGTELIWNWHLDVICAYLMAFHHNELPDRRLIINIPPGTLKSILVSVMYPAWTWIERPEERFLTITNEQGLSIRDALRMKQIITSEWFQSKWAMGLQKDQNEKTLYANDKRGFRQSQGISASNTGKRGSCVAGNTMVATQIGDIRIDELFNMINPPMVLSLNHKTGNIELKKILAKKKSFVNKTIGVSAIDGIILTCTPCHRIYTSNGYKKAENINGGILSILQRANNVQAWESSEVQKMRGNYTDMPDLQQRIQARWRGIRQGLEKESRKIRGVLLKEMQSPKSQSRAIFQALRLLQKGIQGKKRKEEILLSKVQGFITIADKNTSRQAVRGVRKYNGYLKLAEKVLLYGLQKLCSLGKDDREGELTFSFNNGQGWAFSQDEGVNKNSRHEYLYGLPCPANDKKKITNSSHRLECREQSSRESNNSMRGMSYKAPQIINCTATVTKSGTANDSREPVPVYDIQVDGNSNFFANGILVHNCIIVDDPIDAAQSYSDVIRQGVNDTWDRSLSSRLNDLQKSGILLIMQRVHERDLAGHLLKKVKSKWTVLSIPMRYEGEPSYDAGKDIGRPDLSDPRTKKGELLFPAKFAERQVRSLEEDLGEFGVSAQLQQRPVPSGGGIIKAHWWRIWADDVPLPKCDHVFLSWDTAFSEADLKTSAYSVCTRWGVFWHEQRQRYCLIILGRWMGRVGYDELRKIAKDFDKEFSPDAFLIEKKSTGISLIQDLKRALTCSVRSYTPGKGDDKVNRAHSVSPMFESGQVYAPNKKWATDKVSGNGVIDYVASFPNGAPPSADITDTVTQACIYLRAGWWVSHPDDEDYEKDESKRKKPREAAYG
jgi:phage terminase large subunit-like protein